MLRYLPNLKGGMGQEIAEKTKQKLEIDTQGKQLNIKSEMGKITAVFIYDLKGQLLYQKTKIDKVYFDVTDLIPKHQLLIVKTVFENNSSQTDKVIF